VAGETELGYRREDIRGIKLVVVPNTRPGGQIHECDIPELSFSLLGLTNLVNPGSFLLQSRRIFTAHPASRLENTYSWSTQVRQS